MALRVSLAPAWVLHARPWRDTSLLVELFTQDYGRVGVIARGARGRRGRPLLQPFQPLLTSWTQRGELGTLGATEADGTAVLLPGMALYAGLYCNELLLRLLPRDDEQPRLFQHYVSCLQALQTQPVAAGLRIFEAQLLTELGYGWDLDLLEDGGHYCVDPQGHLLPAHAGEGEAVDAQTLRALGSGRVDAGQAQALKPLLRKALAAHLSAPLRTPKLLRELQRMNPAGNTL